MYVKYFFTILYFLNLKNVCFFFTKAQIFEDQNPLITHYEDEDEMRKRIQQYSYEKFSHRYHFSKNNEFPEETFKKNQINKEFISRSKRDGGLTMAVLSGVIGNIGNMTQKGFKKFRCNSKSSCRYNLI